MRFGGEKVDGWRKEARGSSDEIRGWKVKCREGKGDRSVDRRWMMTRRKARRIQSGEHILSGVYSRALTALHRQNLSIIACGGWSNYKIN